MVGRRDREERMKGEIREGGRGEGRKKGERGDWRIDKELRKTAEVILAEATRVGEERG